jgi:hypothetical protein
MKLILTQNLDAGRYGSITITVNNEGTDLTHIAFLLMAMGITP